MEQTSPRQPIFNIPAVILLLIGLMAAIHGLREVVSDEIDANLLARFAFVPGRLTATFDPAGVVAHLTGSGPTDLDRLRHIDVGRFFLGDGSLQPWTVLTYALLHGNWTHLGLNAVWLLAFGAPVARRFGGMRFVLFCAVGAVAGAVAHYLAYPEELQPLVGASASVSACMGATLRFMFQPQRRRAALPIYLAPRLPVLAVLRDRRGLAFVAVWFLTNLVTGIAAVPLGLSDAPIAWQAHIGGFLLGLFAFPLFDPVRPGAEPLIEGEPEPTP